MWHKSFCHMWFACNTHATHIKYCVFRMRKSLLLGSDYDVFIVVHMWIVTILHAICMRTACEKTYSFACGKSAFTCDGPHFAWEPWYFACDSHVFACEKRAFACDACWCEPHAKMFPLLMANLSVLCDQHKPPAVSAVCGPSSKTFLCGQRAGGSSSVKSQSCCDIYGNNLPQCQPHEFHLTSWGLLPFGRGLWQKKVRFGGVDRHSRYSPDPGNGHPDYC